MATKCINVKMTTFYPTTIKYLLSIIVIPAKVDNKETLVIYFR